MRAWMGRHPLLTFILLAYGISWSIWIPMAAMGLRVAPGSSVTHFPGLLGPGIAAFLVPLLSGDRAALTALARSLLQVSRPAWRFWAISLSPLALLMLALAVAALSPAGLPRLESFARYSGLPPIGFPAVLGLVLLCNGFGEETGWRGFALPRLQARFGPLRGTLILALLWAGWHIPAFAVVETYRTMSVPVVVFGFGLGILSGALVLSHVAHLTGGSVLAAALWHATYNLSSATAAGAGVVGAVTTTGVMVWATIVLAVELRRPPAASVLRARAEAQRPPTRMPIA